MPFNCLYTDFTNIFSDAFGVTVNLIDVSYHVKMDEKRNKR